MHCAFITLATAINIDGIRKIKITITIRYKQGKLNNEE